MPLLILMDLVPSAPPVPCLWLLILVPAHVQELREGDSCTVLSGQTSSPMNPGGAQPSVCFQKAPAREWWD